jgi:hypothetical protein
VECPARSGVAAEPWLSRDWVQGWKRLTARASAPKCLMIGRGRGAQPSPADWPGGRKAVMALQWPKMLAVGAWIRIPESAHATADPRCPGRRPHRGIEVRRGPYLVARRLGAVITSGVAGLAMAIASLTVGKDANHRGATRGRTPGRAGAEGPGGRIGWHALASGTPPLASTPNLPSCWPARIWSPGAGYRRAARKPTRSRSRVYDA